MGEKSNINVTGIDHIVLFVRDLEVSKRFYMDVLGFWSPNEDAEPHYGRSNRKMLNLRCRGSNLQTLDLNEMEGSVHGGEEMSHIAFTIDSGDRDQVVAELAKFGIAVHGRDENDMETVHLYDPDGHRIQLYMPFEQRDKIERRVRETQAVSRSA